MSKYNYYGLYPSFKRFEVTNKKEAVYSYIVYMLDRIAQMFEYKGLPETIPQRELELLLQINGFACVAQVPEKGLYAFYGGLGGVPDAYYMPTECIVNNPALNFSKILQINKDCVIIRNDTMYRGMVPMFTKYAELLTENDITFRVHSINTRISEVISAQDDKTKDSAEKYLKDIEAGKLGVIGGAVFFDGVEVQPAGQHDHNFTELIEYNQYLRASWFNDIGIQANFNMKRERLNSDEVQLNIKGLLPLVENMLEERQRGLDAVNDMFGTDISVDFKGVWKDTQEEVEQIDQLKDSPEDQTDPEEKADPEQEEPEEEKDGGENE
jgi:hypothetical protein